MTNEEVISVVNLYADMIKRICFTYMKNDNEADDIFQTVFLKLIQCNCQFEDENHRKAWIIKVTINCCKDSLKSFFKKNVFSMGEYKEQYNETADYEWVRDELMLLPEKYRIVLFLYYFEGYSAKEIAKILKCGENTVFTRLKRGKERLKMSLKEEEYEQ